MNIFLKLIRNSGLAFVIQLSPRIADVLLFVFISRFSDTAEAGTLSIAIAYLRIALVATSGLDDLLTRQIAQSPETSARYFTSFWLFRLGIALIIYLSLALLVLTVPKYDLSLTLIILIFALDIIPESVFGVTQAVFLGHSQFRLPAILAGSINMTKLAASIICLLAGGQLLHVAVLWFAISLLGMCISSLIVFKKVGIIYPVDWTPVTTNLRTAFAFVFITTLLGIEAQLDVIILGVFRDVTEVGWYRSATTIAYPLTLFATAYHLAVYSTMIAFARDGQEKLAPLYKNSLRLLSIVILPVVAGIWTLAPQIVAIIYGAAFTSAVAALRILIFSLVFIFLTAPNSRLLLVYNKQRYLMIFAACSVSTNIIMNLSLSRPWGAEGAAVARLISSALFFIMSLIYINGNILHLPNMNFLGKISLAAGVMGAGIVILPVESPILTVMLGIVFYTAALFLMGEITMHEIRSLISPRFRMLEPKRGPGTRE